MITTTPLAPSLDVHRRRADLRTWQVEWQHSDRQLEEPLIPLSGNNILQLQQSVHISNVRGRMEMTLVKQPLSMPESVLKRLAVRTIREVFAQQFASLSVFWLNSLLFFMTADLRKLDDKIAQVRNYRSLGQTRNFLLGGESGMGKTTYLDWLIFNHMPVVEKERNRVRIIGMQAPVSQNTARPLLWRMLLECGHIYAARDNEEIPLMKLVLYFQKCGVELIEQWTGGILRDIMILIRDACRRAIWKVLPLHPRPQALESMTSYIIRLVEANGLQSLNELGVLAGRMTFSKVKNLDYPAGAYPGLAQITGHPEEYWFDMTFFHLIQCFGCAMHRNSFHTFLAGSLAPSLRYCPMCLAEHAPAYYSLRWRFRVLPGCIEHGVGLLDQCGHCQSPLLRYLPQLIRCPTCQGDLRTCPSFCLSDDDGKRLEAVSPSQKAS